MKFSYRWLSELSGCDGVAPDMLSDLISVKTAESEGVHEFGEHLSKVCAALVISSEPIEGSKNAKAVVDTGRYGTKTVVCGAPNCRAGIVTAYVPAGTRLAGKDIRKASIAGVESDGMLASGAELGINRDSGGILELSLNPGDPIAPGPDYIIEIDNKSLTHRPDLWGHHGMAREVAAIAGSGGDLQDPVNLRLIPSIAPAIEVRIEDLSLCPRYSALVFENVTVQQSPLWLQFRLEAIGLNPINNIVDVTNYVMAEIAQPMHAFDADKLTGGIIVRSAKDGEKIAALNGDSYDLNSANLVIADHAGPVAIAGVIGGMDSAISESTKRIVFESANFHAASVRKTSSALKLRTDASMRFEKSQDPANTVRGLARAAELLQQVSPGIRVVGGLADVAAPLKPHVTIDLPLPWLQRKLGRAIEASAVRRILEALQFGVSEGTPDTFRVTVPSWRATKDISIKDDLVEEVGRMIGYSSITPTSPLLPTSVPPENELRLCLHGLRRLVADQGFHEVYNYSFISDETAQQFGYDSGDLVRVLNPIASDQALLRPSLVPGVWKNIVENSRFSDDFRFFEIGHEIHKRSGAAPVETNSVAAAMYQKFGNDQGLFELKRVAECIAPDVRFRRTTALSYEHPARTADAVLHGEVVGRLFEFQPNFVKGRGAVLSLNIDSLMRLGKVERRYVRARRFPSSAFDLSIVASVTVPVGDVEATLRGFEDARVEQIEFVRQYTGDPLPPDQKSVTFRFTVAAPDRTLSSEEITGIRNGVIEMLRGRGYELRV
jgi:phenylalanyl-tRNA synthetase beta chain